MLGSEKREQTRYRIEEREAGWYVQQRLASPGGRAAQWQDVLGPVDRAVAEQELWLRQRLLELIAVERDRRDVG